MSKEQAKGFFEAISKDEKLNEEVKDVVEGRGIAKLRYMQANAFIKTK